MLRPVVVLAIGCCMALFAACGGDAGDSAVTPAPDPEAHRRGVVMPPPEGAAQVQVTLREWEVDTAAAAAPAGQVYFFVQNEGPSDPHEFVVIRTDAPVDALPSSGGRVPEDAVDLIGEIEPFRPGSSASLVLDLAPGSYALICNIAEVEGGMTESHYGLGMRTAFIVQ